MNLISENYLMHHGVKGMKWGVRHDKPRSYSITKNPPSGLTVKDSLRGEQYRLREKNYQPSSSKKIERKAQKAGRKAEYEYNRSYGHKATQKQSLNEGLAAYDRKRKELESKRLDKNNKYKEKLTKLRSKRIESLKNAGYKKYSKTNNPISATVSAQKELNAYRRKTGQLLKKQKGAKKKASTILNRWGNEPVTILGVTGTAKTTRSKYNRMIIPGNGIF